MTIRGRLILMGGSATVGFALLLAIGLYNGWITSRSTAEAQNLREEVRIVNEMRLANLEMILAAMDSIIDRSEGSIRPQRKEVIDASLRMLQSNVEAVDRMASVLGRPELSSTIRPDLAEVSSAMTEVLPSLIARGAGEDEFAKIDDVIDGAGERLNTALTELGRTGYAAASARLDTVSEAAASARTWQVAIAAIFAFAVGAIALMTARSVVRALSRFGADMEAIAGGVLGTAIEAENRTDEIGRLGRSLVSFRNAASEKSQLERRAEELRSNAERERERTERAKGEEAALTRAAVESLGKGLRRLAEGDLTVRLETPFAGDLEPLRTNFNGAVQQLRETIETIGMAAAQINSGTEEIDATAHDLARRSEQQAASVEETAAAVEQITAAVQSAAERAEETARLVGSARQQAEHSGDVVQAAMSAMDHIAASSEDISRIISVIDDIALQTSLLALNAGVEAARAGDAGKGFAVVAQEVRQLSQRSTNAAKEIKKLILSSGDEVTSGVSQVRATGEALKKITSAVQDVAVNVVAILDTTREQSAGLQDINSSIGSIDTATQQSAALAQGANRSTQNLREQVERINTLLGGFRTTTTPDVVATHTRRVA